MVPRPSTMAGTSMCQIEPQPATGSTEKPNRLLRFTSVSWLKAATTKLGTEMPRITRNMMMKSGN